MYIAGGWYVARYNYTDSRSDGNSKQHLSTLSMHALSLQDS
jgi:hypothetical protein